MKDLFLALIIMTYFVISILKKKIDNLIISYCENNFQKTVLILMITLRLRQKILIHFGFYKH